MLFHSILEFSTNSIHGYVRSPMPPTTVGPTAVKSTSMESWISASRSAPVERVAMVKIAAVVIEVVAIDDRAAVGDVGVVVVNRGATVPIIIPVMPAPPKSAEEADSKTTAKVN